MNVFLNRTFAYFTKKQTDMFRKSMRKFEKLKKNVNIIPTCSLKSIAVSVLENLKIANLLTRQIN